MTRTAHPRLAADKLEALREVLQCKAAELRQRLTAERVAEVVQRPEEPLDFGDWCQKSHDEWLFLNQNRLEMAVLRDVEDALRRLDQGAYGCCQECEQPIAERRLSVVPWARYCAACQERFSDAPCRS